MNEISSYSSVEADPYARRMACPGQFAMMPNSSSQSEFSQLHPAGSTRRQPRISVARDIFGLARPLTCYL